MRRGKIQQILPPTRHRFSFRLTPTRPFRANLPIFLGGAHLPNCEPFVFSTCFETITWTIRLIKKKQKKKQKNRGKRRKLGRDKKLRLPGCSTALSLLSRRDKRFSSSSRIVIATLPSAEIVPVTISDSIPVVADRSRVDSECAQSREVSGRGLQFARETVAESTSNNRTTGIILVGSKSFLFLEAPGSFDSSRQLSSHVRSTIRSPLASLRHSRKGFRFVFPLIVADFRVTLEIDKQWWSF